jgi:hypothetical protein
MYIFVGFELQEDITCMSHMWDIHLFNFTSLKQNNNLYATAVNANNT